MEPGTDLPDLPLSDRDGIPRQIPAFGAKALLRVTEFVQRRGAARTPAVAAADLMPFVDAARDWNVLLYGAVQGDLAKPATWLTNHAWPIKWKKRFDLLIGILAQPHSYSHIMINLDDLGGIYDAYDSLIDLRLRFPELPVILVSRSFAVDDMDLERIWLCDVSLRAPVTFKALELAMTVSTQNNAVWQARCAARAGAAQPVRSAVA